MDPFIDVIYIIVVVPTLLYIGLKKEQSPHQLFKFALLLGLLTLVYHVTNLLDLRSPDTESKDNYEPVPDRSNNAEISNNIIG